MIDWNKHLAEIEEEYLIGLTNKGIVKRACKDKEKADIKILKLEEEVTLQVDGETVILSIPLGESKCSCPSRSICKHIIMGILALQESVYSNTSMSASEESLTADSSPISQKTLTADNSSFEKSTVSDTFNQDSSNENLTATACEHIVVSKNKSPETGSSSLQERLWEEIRTFPEKNLFKIMGNRRLNSFYNKANEKIMPEIEESSVFTLQLPGENTTVKLLSPLEYSSCTCHKKDLCIHKAEAILWCKLKAGALSLQFRPA